MPSPAAPESLAQEIAASAVASSAGLEHQLMFQRHESRLANERTRTFQRVRCTKRRPDLRSLYFPRVLGMLCSPQYAWQTIDGATLVARISSAYSGSLSTCQDDLPADRAPAMLCWHRLFVVWLDPQTTRKEMRS